LTWDLGDAATRATAAARAEADCGEDGPSGLRGWELWAGGGLVDVVPELVAVVAPTAPVDAELLVTLAPSGLDACGDRDDTRTPVPE